MSAWFTRHIQTCIGALGRLSTQRMASAMTILVIGIALALPACLQVLVRNARIASGDLTRAVNISVYFKPGTEIAAAEQQAARVRERRDVAEVRLISADEGLKEFGARSGFGAALDALTANPLPHALVVRPAVGFTDDAQLESLAHDLKALANVDIVQLDTAWVERFNAILDTVKRIVLIVAILLALGVLIIVGNAIRAEIQSRQAEIEIIKLIGGSNAFVRRPFLYMGFWYGLIGGLIALSISYLIAALLTPPIRRLAGLYGSNFALVGLGGAQSFELIGAAIGLGWLGSLLATTRHLRRIEPQ